MTVDPSDSSYMPSVVVLSAGDSIQTLKEIKTVHISATDSVVTLMEDAHEVRRYKVFFFFFINLFLSRPLLHACPSLKYPQAE